MTLPATSVQTETPPLAKDRRPSDSLSMLTGAQIRAARALLKWSAASLAKRCGVSYPAIQRAERGDDMPNMHTKNLMAIKSTLEAAGVEFLDGAYSGDGGPGVRLR